MAQPQHQIPLPSPSPAFSPPTQVSPSLTTPQVAGYGANHPAKRQRMSPAPGSQLSQPGSPYVPTTSFTQSPAAVATPPPSASASSPPPFPNNHHPVSAPPLAQTSMAPHAPPCVNGNSQNGAGPNTYAVPGLTMPSRTPAPGTPPVVVSPALPTQPALPMQHASTTPLTPASASSPYTTTNVTLVPIPTTPVPIGTMGPPSKPADRPAREVQYDVDDSLAGTGIDLKEEEQIMAQFYAGTTRPEAKTGFPANSPGASHSMYGAGLANQPAQPVSTQDQAQFATETAKTVWSGAAARLASVRSQEVRNPFTNIAVVHRRAMRVAKEHGIGLILDPKNNNGMGKMRLDSEFPQPSVVVETKITPDGAMVTTTSSFLPDDSFLAEQIGLLSIATKHRLRQLLEDADRVAAIRQKTSHGAVPPEWADAAVPVKTVDAGLSQGSSAGPSGSGAGDGNAASPRSNPLKRPFGTGTSTQLLNGKPDAPSATFSLAATLRELGKAERDAEEARLRKRQKRAEEEDRKKRGETSANPSRAGSVAPGTPGSVAPDPEPRAPTKKELKSKAQAQKAAEMASTTSHANRTSLQFLSGFGKKKKGKEYSWLTAGGSGASTPTRTGGPGTPSGGTTSGAIPGPKVPEVVALTVDGRYRHGEFREDHDKGKNIQLRDWVAVLESDRLEVRALQLAYDRLDASSSR